MIRSHRAFLRGFAPTVSERSMLRSLFFLLVVFLPLLPSVNVAQQEKEPTPSDLYQKFEYMIPMRDGVNLYTAVYVPKDRSQRYPIMLLRTPYTARPYGPDMYPRSLGPSKKFMLDGFIFAYQDIRGKFKSEGAYVYHRPYDPNKHSNQDVDETTDTYDTIDWLVKNIPDHNGKVGIWGISYPGYLAAMGLIDAHPNLVAVSPQAPMGDTFLGDDFHHNGAFFMIHAFRWIYFTSPAWSTPEALSNRPFRFDVGTPDGYRFFLEQGALPNITAKYFSEGVPDWTDFMNHGTYDEYWQPRNVPQHMKNIKPAVMIVGGWFDSEDPYGAVHIYNAIEKNNPNTQNIIVLGPWHHGGWARVDGDTLGNIRFGQKTSLFYRENIEFPFFNYYLKGKGDFKLPEAYTFMTGANDWRQYDQWPPNEMEKRNLYLHEGARLSFDPPGTQNGIGYDEYVSDPSKPVPFTSEITQSMGHIFMVEDQRFAWSRTDVLSYETEELTEDVTIAGPIFPTLYVSTTGTDCDWIVKLIDVYPGDAPDNKPNPARVRMGHFQMLVGAEVFRSKFRNSFSEPEPVKPGEITKLSFRIPDKHHRFLKGHRIMVQIQSTWFPLVDRNPGVFTDIYKAKDSDFRKTTQRVYRTKVHSSHLVLPVLEK